LLFLRIRKTIGKRPPDINAAARPIDEQAVLSPAEFKKAAKLAKAPPPSPAR
jgi:hypothetical protein